MNYKKFIYSVLFKLFTIFLLILLGLILLFILIKTIPGSSDIKYISTAFSLERQQELQNIYGSDNSPILVQLFKWMKNTVNFDFGHSTQSGLPVKQIILSSFLPTILLSFLAVTWGLLIGFPFALVSATNPGSKRDKFITLLMVLSYSLPAYWIGLFFLQFFSYKLNIFPSSQLFDIPGIYPSLFSKFTSVLYHLFLPSLALGLSFAAYFYKYLKTKLIDILDSEYILAAKARGLSAKTIILSHIIPNLILPVLSLFSTITPLFFSGAVTIEYIFSIPGIGRTMINAAVARDIPLIIGGATISFIAIMLINTFYDILLVIFNPKIKTEWINETNNK